MRVPKSLDERMVEEERNETLYKAVGSLPEIQRRRFLLYYEYEFNFYQIAAMEHCTASAIQNLISWNGKEPKYDIRSFSPNREKCGKGITLNADEAAALLKALQKELNSED